MFFPNEKLRIKRVENGGFPGSVFIKLEALLLTKNKGPRPAVWKSPTQAGTATAHVVFY